MTARTPKLTLGAAKAAVRPLGFSLTKQSSGDYRLAPATVSVHHRQARAYFTNELADAIATAAYEARMTGNGTVA